MQHDSPTVNAVVNWWKLLHADHGDRGARARLKRCESVFDALLEPETHRLIASVHENGYVSEKNLAVLALALARVKPAEKIARFPNFSTVLGHTQEDKIPTGDARPRLSSMRFSALLRASADKDNKDRFALALRRALAILGDKPFNVRRFVRDVLFFNDQTRQQWTFEYYHTRRADTPENTQPQEETQL